MAYPEKAESETASSGGRSSSRRVSFGANEVLPDSSTPNTLAPMAALHAELRSKTPEGGSPLDMKTIKKSLGVDDTSAHYETYDYPPSAAGRRLENSELKVVLANRTKTGAFEPSRKGSLSASEVEMVVHRLVHTTEAIDLHTHIFPASHGQLLLYGIDELLTYHYLVAELFMVIPWDGPISSPDDFFSWPKAVQAELVFEELFVNRSPLSEACRGVVTSMQSLGLGDKFREATRSPARGSRLTPLREWFAKQDPYEYVAKVFKEANLKYAVMTNVPFNPEEAMHWFPADGTTPTLPDAHKPSLRVDPLLSGDWGIASAALLSASPPYPNTLDGLATFLDDWVDRMNPVYWMASTPAGFKYEPEIEGKANGHAKGATPSAAQTLALVLRLAAERGLPVALKVGCVRGVNPALGDAGDGVEEANLDFLVELCSRYPEVKFLVTVLSPENQHELCVLARKFGNLHVYGCWWFCNNPSIIESTTRMRLEMLGSAFSAQHSDARVLEQLVYKWKHSRAAIAPVLAKQYSGLVKAGWELTEAEVERDIKRLFGGAYEEFINK